MSSQDHSRAGALIIQEIITILFLINTPGSETLSTAWQRGGGYEASIGVGWGQKRMFSCIVFVLNKKICEN